MNNIPASTVKQAIIYLNLLSYSPPSRVDEFSSPEALFGEAWPGVLEKAAWLMVSFQQASREPDAELVAELAAAALAAHYSPEACRAFQEKVDALAQLPGRTKAKNRLHRKRGCQLCESPCRYGFFSLVTEPDFSPLQKRLETEHGTPVQSVWQFTFNHVGQTCSAGQWHIARKHLGNLSYCLVSLATAKSRYPFPEKEMRKFQALNQAVIRNWSLAKMRFCE